MEKDVLLQSRFARRTIGARGGCGEQEVRDGAQFFE